LSPSLVPSSLPCTGSSSDAFNLVICAENPSIRSSPEDHRRCNRSSHPPARRQDTTAVVDHTPGFAVLLCTPSITPLPSPTSRSSPPSGSSTAPRRRWPES
jgi:hypothetical protein